MTYKVYHTLNPIKPRLFCLDILYIYLFVIIYPGSRFNSVELLSMRVLPSLLPSQEHCRISIDKQFSPAPGLTEGLNSESYDTKLNALTGRIHINLKENLYISSVSKYINQVKARQKRLITRKNQSLINYKNSLNSNN